MSKRTALTIAALACLLPSAALAQDAGPATVIEGTWLTKKASEITIVPCPEGYCGLISKIVVPPEYVEKYGQDLEAAAGSFTDMNNKDPALRNRPIQNLQILNVKAGGDPNKFEGELYNPEDGNLYSGYLEVLGPDRIKLNGCVLFNLVCMGEEWVRVTTPPTDAAAADGAAAPGAAAPAAAPVPQTRPQSL